MTVRTVTVHLKARIGEYLSGMKMSEKAAKDLRQETDRLNKAGAAMSKGGIYTALAGVPGLAAGAAAGLAAIPAFALGGAAALGTLMVATNGVGDAMKAAGEGDAAKLNEAMAELSENARVIVREYQKVRPVLAAVADRTQDAFWQELIGNLDMVTGTYLPVLLQQAPRLSAELGRGGASFATWATAPMTVAKVNSQFDLAVDVTADLNRLLLATLGIVLDLADAGQDFARGTVDGLADGAEALERWVSNARASGQLNDIFENGERILARLGQTAGDAGELLADIVDNPALVDGAEALFDVLGLTLDVVHGLLLAFEALPEGVQSTVVTVAVLGGTALIVAGRILALKAALDSMKLSVEKAGTSAKAVGGFLGGPWGAALTVATVVVAGFAMQQADAKARSEAFAGSLDEQTGAITENTRALVAKRLEERGYLDAAERYGIASSRVVDAVLGDTAAIEEYRAALKRWETENHVATQSTVDQTDELVDLGKEITAAQAGYGRITRAVNGTTAAVNTQIVSIEKLGSVLRAQNDPAFALIKAQQDLTAAQKDYNAAVKEHGKTSPEAKAASLKLAEQSIILAEAVGKAGEAFDGKLSPALRATLEAAGLTEQQIADVEQAFRTAEKSGDKFAKDYEANVSADTAEAQAAVQKLILKVLQLKNKKIRIDADVYWDSHGNLHVPGGTQMRRWGGIDYHMARGGTIQAHHATAPTVMYGERATGGEAFIPRNGDKGRSLSILSTAASWYGTRLASGGGGGGGGGGGPVMVDLTLRLVDPRTGRETVQQLRAEAIGRGVPRATVSAAYP